MRNLTAHQVIVAPCLKHVSHTGRQLDHPFIPLLVTDRRQHVIENLADHLDLELVLHLEIGWAEGRTTLGSQVPLMLFVLNVVQYGVHICLVSFQMCFELLTLIFFLVTAHLLVVVRVHWVKLRMVVYLRALVRNILLR